MTLTLLDLYNSTATQEWSMYDNDAASDAEFETSLVLAINKAAQEILYSYPFGFRDRTHVIFCKLSPEFYLGRQDPVHLLLDAGYLHQLAHRAMFHERVGQAYPRDFGRKSVVGHPLEHG